jgi:lambda family phage portal protein
MNLLDRAISYVFPLAGLRRAHARKVLRGYQGAQPSRTNNRERAKNQAADGELLGRDGADAMRAEARKLVRDNPYAWNVVDTIVSNIIGDGITAQSTFETAEGEDIEDVNDIRDKVWSEWCEVCDINGELSFSEIQILAQREMVEAGECIVRFIRTPGKTYRGITRPVPLALEMIEADRIATDRDNFAIKTGENGNRIVRGVELDDKGKVVAYHIYPEHPNSPYITQVQNPERVPASDCCHLYRKDRIGQNRGVTWFAPSTSNVRDLGIYVENEIQSSAVASCFAVHIKTESPAGGLFPGEGQDTVDTNGNRQEYIEPGLIFRGAPNDSVEVINPTRPNSGAETWVNLMLRGICAGTGTNYEAIAKDFSKTSYSSSRTSKLEDRPRYKRGQKYIVIHLCQRTWDEFFNAAAREGLDNFPTSAELLEDRRGVSPVEWQLPEQEWVDPDSEQKAAESSLNSFTDTYQSVVGSKGKSFRSVFYQRAKEERLRLKLGLLTADEKTAQMMAQQTGATTPADEIAQDEAGGTGEWMGLSRLQWNRNRKALTDVLNGLADGSMSKALAEAQLAMIGLSQKNIDAIVADASDGTVDQPLPAEQEVTVDA